MAWDTRLKDGELFTFCPPADGVMLIVSRGLAEAGNRTPFGLTWGQVPSDKPCTDDGNVDESTSCLIGSWVVTNYPPIQQATVDASKVDLSHFVFTFNPDGGISGTYGIVFKTDTGDLTISIPFSGTYQISPSTDGGTIYTVERFVWEI